MKILVTGGCGFIGSHFIRLLKRQSGEWEIVNLDALTYAGKLENLEGIDERRYLFVQGNICDARLVSELFREHDFDAVVNFAAESHVDNSIKGPAIFLETNVRGCLTLLDCAYHDWEKKGDWRQRKRFLQISTDEVYGSLAEDDQSGKFREDSPLNPSSPYSASKASADLIAQAFHRTFGMPVLITRCSNNYGPYQDAEKLIPLMITQALKGKKCPVYGDGKNVRDWLHVEDHCSAVLEILRRGRVGEVYHIGGNNEQRNIDIVKVILKHLQKPENFIEFVADRLGHDRRYAMDTTKLQRELRWKPRVRFEEGLKETVEWYRQRSVSKEAGYVS